LRVIFIYDVENMLEILVILLLEISNVTFAGRGIPTRLYIESEE
jgi:hypothetical protein